MRLLPLTLSLLCCLSAPALGQGTFPRCELEPEALRAFHEHYGQARLWTIEGLHEKARAQLEAALKLCVDAELLLRLADNADKRGDQEAATRYREAYEAQLSLERRVALAMREQTRQPKRLRLEAEPVYLDATTSPGRLVLGARPAATPIYIETTPSAGTSIEIQGPGGTSRFLRQGAADRLPPGRYTVIVRANGWNTVRRQVKVSGRRVLKMIFVLSRASQ